MTHAQLTQLVQALLDAPTSNETVKEVAQSWLNAEGNTLKILRQKALNSATAQDARRLNILLI